MCEARARHGAKAPRRPVVSTHTRSRRLGTTQLEVSALGLGTAAFGGIFGARDPAVAERTVLHALERGLNLIDTAPSYGGGRAETIVGAALRGRRNDVILSTKVGSYGKDDFDFSVHRIREELAASLKRLRTDYVDILLAHDIEYGEPDQIVGETLPYMRQLQRDGIARCVGVSGLSLGVLRTVLEAAPVDVVLPYCRYALHDQSLDRGLLPWCDETGILLGSPLAMGMLTADGPPSWHPASAELVAASAQAADLCARRGHDLSVLAMQFVLAHPRLDCVLTGASCATHVDRNLSALGEPPDPELLASVLHLFDVVPSRTWPSGNGLWPTKER
jgi:L-galactose dehydrogenase